MVACSLSLNKKLSFTLSDSPIPEEELMLSMIDSGVEDIQKVDNLLKILGPKDYFGKMQDQLQTLKIIPDEARLIRQPLTYQEADNDCLIQIQKLLLLLADDDDIIYTYANLKSASLQDSVSPKNN